MSGELGALGIDVDGVERLAGGHEQAVFLGATETEIGAGFGEMNLADELAVGRKNMHSIEVCLAPTRGGPDVAVRIAANAIG